MYKVRFHLGGGSHFKQWQVKGPEGVMYHDPESVSIVLRGCTLMNRRGVAERVKESQVRDVCGYVLCESVEVSSPPLPAEGSVVHFDPKVLPYWTVEGREDSQDGSFFPVLVGTGRRLRAPRL